MLNPYRQLEQYINKEMSYEQLCELIDEPVLSRQNKSRHIKKLRDFMDLKLDKGNVTIKSLHSEEALLLIDKKAKFVEYIEDLLIVYLAKTPHSPTLTYKELAEYFCLVNKNYYEVKYNRQQYLKNIDLKTNMIFTREDALDMKYRDMGYFFTLTDKIIKEIIKNALKSLKQRSLILYQDTFKLYKTTYSAEHNMYINETFILNQEERELFLGLRKGVMKKHGLNKLQDIIYMNKQKREEYFAELSETLQQCDKLYNCDKYANAFTIEYTEGGIQSEYKAMMETNKKMLNYNVQHKLLTTKEMDCINAALKKCFVDDLVDKKL